MRLFRESDSPIRRLAVTGVVFLAVLLSCGKDVTSPNGRGTTGRVGSLAVAPQFPEVLGQTSGAGGTVAFNRVRIILRRTDLTIALDKTVDFPADATTIPLVLDIPLLASTPASGESFTLSLEYLNSDGAIVFTGGPTSIVVTPTVPGSPPPKAVDVPVKYSGPGANATKVVIAPKSLAVPTGAAFSFTAQALDASNAVLAGTPIVFSSLDPSRATISASGAGNAVAVRGTARIVAQLLTGPADTATLTIQPVATTIAAVSGSGQTNSLGATLAQPIVVMVTAADGLGVPGVSVTFAASNGGVVAATATTDASGNAQSTWKLGTTVGAQTATATAGSLAAATFTATATPATPVKLITTASPGNSTAGVALGNFVVAVQDANNNVVTTFTGPVTVSLSGGASGATFGGTTTVNAVAGIATFSGLVVDKVGSGYVLTAAASGLTSATSSSFAIAVGSATKLVFGGQPNDAIAGASVGTLTVAVQDVGGNPVTTFTGAVSLGFALNPGGATLGGTTTVNAVAGIATFGGITVNRPGIGYAFVASSAGLSSSNSGTFSVVTGPAAFVALVSGGAQIGSGGATLAQPIRVQVTDAFGNVIAGKSVTFAVATGGGSVSPTVATTNTQGQASTVWTLGGSAGAQTMTATGAGLTPSPLTISATATISTITWTGGAASTTWLNTANWSPASLPSASTTVIIPTTPYNPVLPSNQAVADITFTGNGQLNVGAFVLTVNGNFTADTLLQRLICAGGSLTLAGAAKTVGGRIADATITGTYSVNPTSAFAAQNLTISGSGALTVNGGKVSASNLYTTGGGKLNMTNAADSVTATSDVGFQGGASSLTNGKLVVGGNFLQSVNSGAFGAGANHATYFINATSPTLNFSDPNGTLGKLYVTQGTLNVNSLAKTVSDVYVQNSATLSGTGHLTVGGNFRGDFSTTVQIAALELKGTLQHDNGGFFHPDTTIFSGTGGQRMPADDGDGTSLNYKSVVVRGNVRAWTNSTQYQTTGDLLIPGTLRVGNAGNRTLISVGGNLATSGSGVLQMNDSPSDTITVSGNATFSGGNTNGLLTKGTLAVNGAFTQNTNATAFVASATFLNRFIGFSSSYISFANPDSAVSGSHFGTVEFCNTESGNILSTDVFAVGQLIKTCNTQSHYPYRDGALGASVAPKLTVAGADVGGSSFGTTYGFQRVRLSIADGATLARFDSAAFDNFAAVTGETQLEVHRATGNFTFYGLTFSTLTTNTNNYVGIFGPAALTVTLSNTSRAQDQTGGKQFTSGGATLIWLPSSSGLDDFLLASSLKLGTGPAVRGLGLQ
jgi:hypothetical protein